MEEKKKSNKELEDEKILFGVKNKTCFACGQTISEKTRKCPYCGIEL